MNTVKSFRHQHSEIVSLVNELSLQLSATNLKHKAKEVRSLLSKFSGKLSVHLSMEDQNLYPFLMNHPDIRIRNLAHRFTEEMGGILSSFSQYKTHWPTHMEIADRPEEFVKETRELFAVLSERIDRENNELYPLLER